MTDEVSDVLRDEEDDEEDNEIDPDVLELVNEEKESGWARAWRYWRYAWTVIKNLIYIGFIYLAFERMTSVFETLVLALLILIYQAVANTFTFAIRTFAEEAHVNRGMLLGLYKKFKDPEAKEGERTLSEIVKEYHKSDAFFYINGVFSYLIYLFVLWKVISALFF
jgi:hypothetical protein